MHFKRKSRRFTAWIAMLAILLGALAPALSHAGSQGGKGTPPLQLCTVAGMKMVAVDEVPTKSERGLKRFPAERCPFCATHFDSVLPPAAPAPGLALQRIPERFPSLHQRSPGPRFAWAAAQPRAPPFPA